MRLRHLVINDRALSKTTMFRLVATLNEEAQYEAMSFVALSTIVRLADIGMKVLTLSCFRAPRRLTQRKSLSLDVAY